MKKLLLICLVLGLASASVDRIVLGGQSWQDGDQFGTFGYVPSQLDSPLVIVFTEEQRQIELASDEFISPDVVLYRGYGEKSEAEQLASRKNDPYWNGK